MSHTSTHLSSSSRICLLHTQRINDQQRELLELGLRYLDRQSERIDETHPGYLRSVITEVLQTGSSASGSNLVIVGKKLDNIDQANIEGIGAVHYMPMLQTGAGAVFTARGTEVQSVRYRIDQAVGETIAAIKSASSAMARVNQSASAIGRGH